MASRCREYASAAVGASWCFDNFTSWGVLRHALEAALANAFDGIPCPRCNGLHDIGLLDAKLVVYNGRNVDLPPHPDRECDGVVTLLLPLSAYACGSGMFQISSAADGSWPTHNVHRYVETVIQREWEFIWFRARAWHRVYRVKGERAIITCDLSPCPTCVRIRKSEK